MPPPTTRIRALEVVARRRSAGLPARWHGLQLALVMAACSASSASSRSQPSVPGEPSPRPLAATATGTADGDKFVLPRLTGPDIDSLAIDVKGYTFEGNTVFPTAALQQQVEGTIGQRLDPSALDEVRLRISRLYIEAGYLNSGAVLVDVDASRATGIVRIRVVEGRIGEVRIRGLERLDPRYLRSRLLQGDGEPLNVDRLQERFRLLLADPLFDKINSRIVPGEALGSAVLDIEVERAKPYALDLFVNNYRPPSSGATAVGVHGLLRNLTGLGDTVEATLQHTQGGDPAHLAASVAPWAAATRIYASYDRSVAAVVEESLAAVDIKSRSSRVEVGVGQALVDTLQRHVELTLGISRQRSSTTLLGMPFSFALGEADGVSQVQALNFSQDWTERWAEQALALRSTFVAARGNVDTAAAQAVAVDPESVPRRHNLVWLLQAQHVRTSLPGGGELRLRGSLQATGQRLLPLQQFELGGVGSVRGYRENAVLRDRGWAASAEYRQPLIDRGASGGNSLAGIAFYDTGAASDLHAPWQHLAALGVGLSWQSAGFSADLSYARRLRNLDTPTSGNLQDRGVQFQLSYRAF